MATGSVKFSVEAAQFKADMAKVNAELKTQKQEIKNVEKSFNSSTTAEEKFTAKGKLLNQMAETAGQKVQMLNTKFEDEKRKLAECAAKLEEAKKAHGENSKEVEAAQLAYTRQATAVHNAKTALVAAQGEVDSITREYKQMEDAANGAGEEQKDLSKNTKDVGEAATESKEKVSIFGDILKANLASDLIKKGISSIINGVKQIGTACVNAAKGAAKIFGESVQWADDIATLSVQTGISTKTLQEYQYMTGLVDVSVETLTGSHTKLLQAMNKAQGGAKGSIASFEKLGVSWKNTDGSLRSTTDVFNDAINALGKMTNESERDALAMEIFGKKAQELNPLIEAGEDAIKGFADEAHRVGAVLDDEAIGQLTRTQDALDRIKATWAGTKRQLSAKFAPAIATALEKSIPLLNSFSNVLMSIGQKVMPVFEKFINFAVKALDRLDKAFKKNGLAGLATEFGKILNDAIKQISAKAPKIISAALTVLKNVGSELLKALPGIFDKLVAKIPSLLSKIGDLVKDALPKFAETIGQMLGSLLRNAPAIINAGIDLVESLFEGVFLAIPKLFSGLQQGLNENLNDVAIAEHIDYLNSHMEAFRDTVGSVKDAAEIASDALIDINAKQEDAEYWLDIYDSLYQKTDLTKEEQTKLNRAVERLTELYPELGGIIEGESGKWETNTSLIRDNIKALSDRATAEAYFELAKEATKEKLEYERQYNQFLEEQYKPQADITGQLRLQKQELEQIENRTAEQELRLGYITTEYERENGALKLLGDQAKVYYDNMKKAEDNADYFRKMGEAADAAADRFVELSQFAGGLKEAFKKANGDADEFEKAFLDTLSKLPEDAYLNTRDTEQVMAAFRAALLGSGGDFTKFRDLFVTNMSDLPEKAKEILNNTEETFKGTFTVIKDDAYEEGKDVGEALMDGGTAGIAARISAFVAKAKSAVTKAIAGMKLAGDIHSPSRLTRDLIGKNLGLGIGVGFEEAINSSEMKRRLDMSDVFSHIKVNGDDLTATINHSLDGSTAGVYRGANKTYNITIGNIEINAPNVKNVEELYDLLMERMHAEIASKEAVFA